MARGSGIPSGKMPPAPLAPIDASKVKFVGRVKQPVLGGGKGVPITKSQGVPRTPVLNRAAIHRNKSGMTPTPEGY